MLVVDFDRFFTERKVLLTTMVLSDRELRAIREHKYSSTGSSICDKYLNYYWNWLVEQVPTTVAPNTLTIVGLAFNIVTTIILMLYAPTATENAPRWTYAMCAVGLFFYQSLDAIDGKQARRTGSSSPLGELFDHGCDSVSTVFLAAGLTTAVGLGHWPIAMIALCTMSNTLFYMAHWQTYCTGQLSFSAVDVTETQLVAMLFFMISAVFGGEVWGYEVPLLGIEVRSLGAAIVVIGAIGSAYQRLSLILYGGIGKNGSTVANTSVLFPIIPLLSFAWPAFYLAMQEPRPNEYENHASIFCILFGIVAAKISCRMVIAHMAKAEMPSLDPILLAPVMLCLTHYLNLNLPMHYMLWLGLAYALAVLFYFSYAVCTELCETLNIFTFKLGPRNPAKLANPAPKIRDVAAAH